MFTEMQQVLYSRNIFLSSCMCCYFSHISLVKMQRSRCSLKIRFVAKQDRLGADPEPETNKLEISLSFSKKKNTLILSVIAHKSDFDDF